jgi:type II secretory pathway component PulF
MAGERSGNLDSVIRRYVAYEKVIGTVRKRTISALHLSGDPRWR